LEDLMVDASDSPLSIRAALNRKALADARQRAALAGRLGFTENEVLAVQHLARAGELTPGQVGAQLQLSSGGTTAVLHRLQRAGHITSDVHPRDGRSAVVRLTPSMQESATESWAPLVAELDALALEHRRLTARPSRTSSKGRLTPLSATPTLWPGTPTPRRMTRSPCHCQRFGHSADAGLLVCM